MSYRSLSEPSTLIVDLCVLTLICVSVLGTVNAQSKVLKRQLSQGILNAVYSPFRTSQLQSPMRFCHKYLGSRPRNTPALVPRSSLDLHSIRWSLYPGVRVPSKRIRPLLQPKQQSSTMTHTLARSSGDGERAAFQGPTHRRRRGPCIQRTSSTFFPALLITIGATIVLHVSPVLFLVSCFAGCDALTLFDLRI